jgi:DNA-binding response OmpR family regulator
MSIQITSLPKNTATTTNTTTMRTIVFCSRDIDFCASIRFLFQDRFRVITITDPNQLLSTVEEFQPNLVIIDSIMSEKMRRRFEMIKRANPNVRIISFYAARLNNKSVDESGMDVVDRAFSKPLDLSEITESIHALIT